MELVFKKLVDINGKEYKAEITFTLGDSKVKRGYYLYLISTDGKSKGSKKFLISVYKRTKTGLSKAIAKMDEIVEELSNAV